MSFSLLLPEPPSANRWWRRAGTHMHLSKEAKDYKAVVANLAMVQMAPMYRTPIYRTGEIRVTLWWVRGRKSGDLDKRIGVVLDALQGIVYANDSQIVEIHAERSDDKGNASLRIRVEEV